MTYEIIRQKDSKTWYLENPAFVRLSDENIYCLTNEANAHAVYIEGVCYHILGRAYIQGLDEVTIGPTSGEVYSNVEVKEKIDANAEAIATTNTNLATIKSDLESDIDDLWVAILERQA